MTATFSEQSLQHVRAFPGVETVERSDAVGWTSMLVTHSRAATSCSLNDTLPTPDQCLCLTTSGAGDLDILDNGVWRRGPFTPGTAYLSGASERFRYRWQGRPGTAPVERLHIFMADALFADAVEHFRKPGLPTPEHAISALGIQSDVLATVGQSLLSAMRCGVPDLYAQATANWLAVHLLSRQGDYIEAEGRRRPGALIDRRLARALEYVHANFDRAVDLNQIAVEAGVSKFHFSRLFHEQLGATPIQYLYGLRLDSAAALLMRGDLPVSVIAYQCGFVNMPHFNRVFRRRFGASPTDYRRSVLREGGDRRPRAPSR